MAPIRAGLSAGPDGRKGRLSVLPTPPRGEVSRSPEAGPRPPEKRPRPPQRQPRQPEAWLRPPEKRPRPPEKRPQPREKEPPPERRAPGAATCGPVAIPVQTHILTPRDDLVDVIRRYCQPWIGPGTVIAISETAVAIVQRRFINPDDVKPCVLARVVSRFVERTGSLSSPFALQAVMNEEGAWRVAGAFLVGLVSRLFLGRRGDFYRLAGDQAALVDDVTGSLPPFDKYIVMGPSRPQAVVDRIQRALGVEVAIVDVNDLGNVSILAASSRVDRGALTTALAPNPAGNDDEQTPIVAVLSAVR